MNNPEANQQKQQLKEIVRILNTDVPGDASIYYGLTRIKGISWSLSNAICHILRMAKNLKIGSLSDSEIKKVEDAIKSIHTQNIPSFILNRARTAAGRAKHLLSSDLDLQTRMDIRHLRDIQSYRGIRHALGLPVRGQKTRSHFRHGRAVGVIKKKVQPKSAPKSKAEGKKHK